MTENLEAKKAVAARHQDTTTDPTTFELLDQEWDLLPGVFAPFLSSSTEIYTQWLPYPESGALLEMGCGTGVTAISAAQNGCAQVTAVDISQAAVENCRRNAVRHGVADRVRVLHSDMFGALDPQDRFDVVFWNSNAEEAPADYSYSSDIERSILDSGYACHRAYLQEGPKYLTENGRLLLGFNSRGNRALLDRLAQEAGLRIVELQYTSREFLDRKTLEFRLLELLPAH